MSILSKKLRAAIKAPSERLKKAQEFRAASDIDTSEIKTLCLAVGPYRNLTTLTASILFLHPNCQVLNHGAARIFGDPRLDFLDHYSDEKFENFLRFAVYISGSGGRGKKGGSIIHSHAFDNEHPMAALYRERFGEELTKPHIHSLFWKESLRTAQHIRNRNIDLGKIFTQNNKLRFLLPIRNPIDCALSNKRTGHAKLFGLKKTSPVEKILTAILEEILWYQDLKATYPDRFFEYFENDFTGTTADKLAEFLLLTPDNDWKQSVLQAFDITHPYQHEGELVAFYRQQVETIFTDHPDFAARLLSFAR